MWGDEGRYGGDTLRRESIPLLLGSVSEASRKCLGSVSEVSRRCLGSISDLEPRVDADRGRAALA